MSIDASDLERLWVTHPHRFNVDEYHQMIEAGILTEDHRVELLEGVIVEMSPIGSRHRAVVTRLYELLSKCVPEGWHVACQQPMTLANSEPAPDLSIVKGKSLDYINHLPAAADVVLLVEVAETSLEIDLRQKSSIYGAAGVPEYWVVDVVGHRVHCLSGPQVEGYDSKQLLDRNAQLRLELDKQRVGVLRVVDFLPE